MSCSVLFCLVVGFSWLRVTGDCLTHVQFLQIEVEAPTSGGMYKRSDPYEFEDDGNTPAMEGYKRNQAGMPIKVQDK